MTQEFHPNPYSLARRDQEHKEGFADLINTNFSSCGLGIPHAVWQDLLADQARIPPRYHPHPAGDPELRAAVLSYYAHRAEGAQTASVVITASASESYSHVFAARCSYGDTILLPRPGYPLFEDIAVRFGLSVKHYDLDPDHDWAPDPGQVESLVDDSVRAVVVISPNNPTGHVVSARLANRIAGMCRNHDLFLLVDEVFSEYVFDGSSPWIGGLFDDVRVYTINGMSKLFAAPQLKVSWVVVTGPQVNTRTHELEVVNDMYLSAAPLSQSMAASLLTNHPELPAAIVGQVAKRRASMMGEVQTTPGLQAVPARGGIHLPVMFSNEVLRPGIDDEALSIDLLERLVGTHPGYFYGIDQPVTLVMSYLANEETIQTGFSRIRDYVSETSS